MNRAPARAQSVSWAKKIQRACLQDEESFVDYSRVTDVGDPLFHMSIEVMPRSSNGRIGFFLTTTPVPRFSSFLVTPQKSSTMLEDALSEAVDTYAGEPKISDHAVLFDGGGKPFVYSSWCPPEWAGGILTFRNRNRMRSIMHLPSFLRAFGLSQNDDE